MEQITVEGTVSESFSGQQEFYLKISEKDLNKTSEFLEKTNTVLRAGSIAVRKKSIVSNCSAGDVILLTLGTQLRRDGMRLLAIDFKKIKSAQ